MQDKPRIFCFNRNLGSYMDMLLNHTWVCSLVLKPGNWMLGCSEGKYGESEQLMLKRCELPNPFREGFWFFFPITLFIYFTFGCPGSCCCSDFSLVWRARAALVAVQGFSLQRPLLLQSTGSRAGEPQQLQHLGSAVEAPGLGSTGSAVVAYQL